MSPLRSDDGADAAKRRELGATDQNGRMGTTHRLTTPDGTELHVTLQDGPGSPVVLLHGLAGSSREMDATAAGLASHRVVSLDSRGHGRSTRRPDDVTRAAHVLDVVQVVETLAEQPVTLVGQSMGGHTALLVAAARPDLVARLVLLEAGVGGDGTVETRASMREFFDSWPRPFASRQAAASFLGRSAIAEAWLDDLEVRGDGLWPRFDTDVMIETIRHVDARACWDEWSSVSAPTPRRLSGVDRGPVRLRRESAEYTAPARTYLLGVVFVPLRCVRAARAGGAPDLS